jgi:hypothetical protein
MRVCDIGPGRAGCYSAGNVLETWTLSSNIQTWTDVAFPGKPQALLRKVVQAFASPPRMRLWPNHADDGEIPDVEQYNGLLDGSDGWARWSRWSKRQWTVFAATQRRRTLYHPIDQSHAAEVFKCRQQMIDNPIFYRWMPPSRWGEGCIREWSFAIHLHAFAMITMPWSCLCH